MGAVVRVFFTSDLHFGHGGVIEYCNRPFHSIAEMNEGLISNWNSVVKEDDLVWVLGDLSFMRFGDFEPLANRLHGRKILIRGNHDKYSKAQYLKIGFLEVLDEAVITFGRTKCRLSHYPYRQSWWKRNVLRKKEDMRYVARRPPKLSGEFLLHGHSHSKTAVRGRSIDVGYEAWGRPVYYPEIQSIIARATK